MKTLVVLIILVLAALYVNADRSDRRGNRRPRPRIEQVDVIEPEEKPEDLECDPATQYGVGKPARRCRCTVPNAMACLKCNVCSCMGARGLWRCTRMGCPFEEENLPWQLATYRNRRGRPQEYCVQPKIKATPIL